MKFLVIMEKFLTIKDNSYEIDKNIFSKAMIFIIATLFICLIFGVWGLFQQKELWQLRNKERLQEEQLVLVNQKVQQLEEKMQTLESLDKEIRQLVSGTEQGKVPQGGAYIKENNIVQTNQDAQGGFEQIINRVAHLEGQSQHYLKSFYTLRALLNSESANYGAEWRAHLSSFSSVTDSVRPSIWPAQGVITSLYGERQDPVSGRNSYHSGIDISNTYGTPVVATADGLIVGAGFEGGYGNLVEISHGDGLITRYGHNSTILVHVGQSVKKGETIALMGSTGKSTGVHVHYEVRVNGAPVNPMLFLTEQS